MCTGDGVSYSVVSDSLFVTSWTAARQTPLSVEFSRQEYWSGLPFPSPGDLSDPRIKPVSVLEGRFFTAEPPKKPGFSLLRFCQEFLHLYS